MCKHKTRKPNVEDTKKTRKRPWSISTIPNIHKCNRNKYVRRQSITTLSVNRSKAHTIRLLFTEMNTTVELNSRLPVAETCGNAFHQRIEHRRRRRPRATGLLFRCIHSTWRPRVMPSPLMRHILFLNKQSTTYMNSPNKTASVTSETLKFSSV